MSLNEVSLRIPTEHMANVFGQFDANIKKIERTLGVTVVVRDDQLKIIGTPSAASGAQEVFEQLYELAKRGNVISEQNVNYALALLQEHKGSEMVEMDKDVICHTIQGKPVKPKTLGQKDYVDNIRKKMIVFGMGPAGTGKTYLAMAMAITAFKNEEVGRIILTRPAIEAGEKLGFLPGDLQSKVDPYLRPLYDALYDAPLRHVLTVHEQGAAHAADGYARASGKAGVCIATSGPGATNLVTGLATAYMDSCPVIAITGQVATPLLGRDAFQEIDITGLTMPITKHSFLVRNVSELAATVRKAFAIATGGRPGPVLIDVPRDILLAEIEVSAADASMIESPDLGCKAAEPAAADGA